MFNNADDMNFYLNTENEELDYLDTISEKIYNTLIDDVIFGLMLQIHRAVKLDYLIYLDPDYDPETDKQYEIYDDNDVLGVFSNLNENASGSSRTGQNSGLLKYECICPNCDRSLAAIRFAPHLEKCMGMGRNSSRIATRRIANYNGDELDQLIEATGIIPNNRYVEQNFSKTTNDDDLMSIINAVATANETVIKPSSSSSSLIDIELSSSSSSCSNNYSNLRPPNAKKKRLHNSKSVNSNMSTLSHQNNTSGLSTNTGNQTQSSASLSSSRSSFC